MDSVPNWQPVRKFSQSSGIQAKKELRASPRQLLEEETEAMVSQNAIPSRKHLGGSLPYAFSEHGISMLANVIKSQRAIAMSIKIIEAFVKFREMVISQKDLLLKFEQLEKLVIQHDDEIQTIFQALKQLIQQKNEPREPVGFKLKGK